MQLPRPDSRPRRVGPGLAHGVLALAAWAWLGLAWADPAVAPLPANETGCSGGPAERHCWTTLPMLRAPNGMLIQFDDDVPNQGWQLSVNLDTPVPLDMSVFNISPLAETGLNGTTAEDGKLGKNQDPQDSVPDARADSWDYELLVILGLGVLAIAASRLRRGRRRRRGVTGSSSGSATNTAASTSQRGRTRVRRRVRLD